jgi:hypothetical protein
MIMFSPIRPRMIRTAARQRKLDAIAAGALIEPPMTDAQWQRVEALFHRALEAPPSEREALAARLCEGDAAIFAELLTLLRSDSVVERLMSRAPVCGWR